MNDSIEGTGNGTGIEMPESRKVALDTALNQIRTARKNLLVASLPAGVEDRVHDMLTDCIHHLQPVSDTCTVIKVRSRDDGEQTEGSEPTLGREAPFEASKSDDGAGDRKTEAARTG